MLIVIFSFLCFVVCCIGAYRVFKAVKANDTENTNKWLGVTITFMLASWIVRWISSVFDQTIQDDSESERKYYFLNEDYTFFDGIIPKAYFKKGDLVSGFVAKGNTNLGKLLGSAQSPAVQDDYLFLQNAKLSIPTNKLRYPTETELTEIKGDLKKFLDSQTK